ncbi:MAG TPA: MFS transporter [Candidatus Saccharimonadales bacterium]
MTQRQRLALWAIIIGSGVVFLDGSVVNLALPKMAAELGSSFSGLQWIMDGYLLSLSALILLGGSLGDIFGRKRMYVIGVIGFALSSLLCGVAQNLELLIFSRILQGVFGALMIPEALAIINATLNSKDRAKAIGLWTAATSAIVAIGPLLGGYLIDIGSWRWIFFINLPLLAVCLWMGLQNIKESKDAEVRRVDYVGALLAMLALGGLTYGLIEGPVQQWSWPIILILAASVITGALFIWYEKHKNDPMLNLHLFRSANFTGANITTLAMYGGLGGFFFILLIHLQTAVGLSSLEAGLSTLPVSALLLFSSRVGVLAVKHGPRLFMTAGPIIGGLGLLLLLPLGPGAHYFWHILPGITIFGAGLTLTVAPLTMTVLAAVRKHDSGIASAVNNAVSRVAGLLVIAILGVFASNNLYVSATILCASLAIGAGVLSWFLIKNPQKQKLNELNN